MLKKASKKSGKNSLDQHFARPKHVGKLDKATHSARVHNPSCDDLLEVYLHLTGDKVLKAQFLAQACSATVALASMACEKATGLSKSEIFSWSAPRLRSWVGELPKAKRHAAELVCRAFRQAIESGKIGIR